MRSHFILSSLAGSLLLTAGAFAGQLNPGPYITPTPFANSNGKYPGVGLPKAFVLSHNYPTALPPPPASFPWDDAIGGGPITVQNADAYMAKLKKQVAADMRALLFDWEQWDAGARGWYNEPWLFSEREVLRGLYVGVTDQPASLWPNTGLSVPWNTFCLSFYDSRAAVTLSNFWGGDALKPAVNTPGASQFAEGSLVLKLAFSSVNATPTGINPMNRWPVLAGAAQWNIVYTENSTEPELKGKIGPVSFFQFDIVVKDSKASPKTGWVFTTFVYDKDAPGQDAFDKMVPLGAMWGNDPGVDSSQPHPPPLRENWINPTAPKYSKMTLGWGDRLAGPNDGARGPALYAEGNTGKIVKVPSQGFSSCLSCHGSAAWPYPATAAGMMPIPPSGPAVNAAANTDYTPIFQPGSPPWNQWFQDRAGNVPQVPGALAMDYDMVTGFKSMTQWNEWKQSTESRPLGPHVDRNYNGLPRRSPAAPK